MKIEKITDVEGNEHVLVWANEREYESMPKSVYEERLAFQKAAAKPVE
jgi:hypothetical protein